MAGTFALVTQWLHFLLNALKMFAVRRRKDLHTSRLVERVEDATNMARLALIGSISHWTRPYTILERFTCVCCVLGSTKRIPRPLASYISKNDSFPSLLDFGVVN